jgi:hypothetical protein
MPASLLPSQLATLQPLEADEPGAVFDDAGGVENVVANITAALPPTPDTDPTAAPTTTDTTTGTGATS